MRQSEHNDDVDRLFACFKCGVAPPESAFKEKRSRSRPKQGTSTVSPLLSESPDGGSSEKLKYPKSRSAGIKSKWQDKKSPLVFYGSSHGLPMKRPFRLFKLLDEIRVDLTKQKDFCRSKEVWATFPRQEEAVRFAKSHSHVFVFSYQDHLNGQRRFLSSTYTEFWRRYKKMNPQFRHHYEVIQEGFPCHLYFDLEFDKKINRDKNGNEMVDILVSVTFDSLKAKYLIEGNPEWVVELDSSTEEKFSRHLIIHLPGTAFKDNSHVGAFVTEICSRIDNFRSVDSQLAKLYIKKDAFSTSDQLFIDNAVYSRNRCFRLVLSSKSGKASFLLPTERFRCKEMNEKQVFMESLICRMDTDCRKLLICKPDLTFQKTLNFDFEVTESLTTLKDFIPKSFAGLGQHLLGKSPFSTLDSFVESIASNGDVSGKIRSWYWFSEYGLMVYYMLRNRYCERIGREHKSNHVMYIVDFKREGYYQKCFDPDCRGYRSPMRPIPLAAIQSDLMLFKSIQKVPGLNFDSCILNHSPTTDTCKESIEWWQEAIKYADCCEHGDGSSDWSRDGQWWMDVENCVLQLELSKQIR